MKTLTLFSIIFISCSLPAQLKIKLDEQIDTIMPKVVEWRHDIHKYPELGNREFRTSKKIEEHLVSLGIEVETKIAYTGLVGLIRGGKPGPTIALRADMDALPVEDKKYYDPWRGFSHMRISIFQKLNDLFLSIGFFLFPIIFVDLFRHFFWKCITYFSVRN